MLKSVFFLKASLFLSVDQPLMGNGICTINVETAPLETPEPASSMSLASTTALAKSSESGNDEICTVQ